MQTQINGSVSGKVVDSSGFVVTDSGETAGAISYWRLSGPVSLEALTAAWEAQGLPVTLLPEQPEPEVALRRAVGELQGKRRLVRPLERRGAWVIKDETVVAGDTVYTLVARVRVLPANTIGGSRFTVEQGDVDAIAFAAVEAQIRDNYRQARVQLAPEDIGSWLVKLVKAQKATSLRESGGVYFIPRPSMDFWRKATNAVEIASGHRVFKIPALKNTEAVEAILDSLTEEARREAEAMETELLATGDDALGKRALTTRSRTCEELLGKVASYESLLGVQMDTIRMRIEALKSNVAAAALLAGTES